MIAKVEPLTPARALRGPFDYRLPAEMDGVGVGSMLLVPFGRRRLIGVVVELAESSELPPERLVEPLEALESGVPAELVSLGLWVAEEYCSTPARGLALVLPPGTGTGAAGRRARIKRVLEARLTAAGARMASAGADPLPADSNEGRPGAGTNTGDGAEILSYRAHSPVSQDSAADSRDQSAAKPGRPRLGPKQRAALIALRDAPMPASEVCRRAQCDHSTLRSLEQRGLVELDAAEIRRRPAPMPAVGGRAEGSARLTEAQEAALAEITRLMEAEGGGRKLLLHGVTGSGKTEVYLRAAAHALERGQGAIVLVPEIALTPQTASRFEQRFGDAVAILHSALSPGERHDEWLRVRRGEARVCVGPRSAVFAPVPDLGLIVIDEEHDPSYKQDGDPRYDARRVAERRAEQCGAVLVAGTATPRPESWSRLERASLPARVDGRALPPVDVVAMLGAPGGLHAATREALEQVRSRSEKAIVLLNRRGWSNFLSCRGCGRVWQCSQCDVSLVLHRGEGRIACHHCGHSEGVPGSCPDCGSVSVARHGAGTERLERELEELMHPLPVFRLDSDSAARDGVAGLLRRFDAAPSGVLVGTQMVAKGHDFPDVTLGAVIDADATMRFPDFRAEERTFALVAQLAGRSGRGARGGRVIVQALEPEARPLRLAAQHDAEGFLDGELARRELLGYPPFSHLIRIVCAHEQAGPELEAAREIAERIESGDVLGPAPLFRMKGRERAQVVVKARDRAVAVREVRRAVEAVAGERSRGGVVFAVDVDPQ